MKQIGFLILGYIRALLICIFGMYVFWRMEAVFFGYEKAQQLVWMLAIANYCMIFVLYRNVFQFKGWTRFRGDKKLSKTASAMLLVPAFLILIFAVFQLSVGL